MEVDPLTRSQIKFSKAHDSETSRNFPHDLNWPSQDYKKVPIAVLSGGNVVGGSTEIVDAVLKSEAHHVHHACSCLPSVPKSSRHSIMFRLQISILIA